MILSLSVVSGASSVCEAASSISWGNLLSGLLGTIVGAGISVLVPLVAEGCKKRDTINSHKLALITEVRWNKHQAEVYLNEQATLDGQAKKSKSNKHHAPAYTLPDMAYKHLYPQLLLLRALDKCTIDKTIKFYNDVNSLNICLERLREDKPEGRAKSKAEQVRDSAG